MRVTRRLALVGFLAACGHDTPNTPATLLSGAAELDFAGDGSTLTLSRDGRALLVFGADAFQVGTVDDLDAGDSFDPYWLLVDAPPAPPAGLTWHRATRMTLASASAAMLAIDVDGARVTFMPEGTDGFAAQLVPTAASTAYLRVASDADPQEGFYGLGEWADTVNHRGKLRPAQMEVDTTLESGDDENHVPVPLVIGTNGWGMFVESRRPGAFDIARTTDTRIDVVFGTGADSPAGLAFHLFSAAEPLDVLGRYFDVAGYPGLPAPWALGPLLWRDENKDQTQVLDDIQQIRTRHLATSGVWFDRPYSTGVETFDWSAAKFSNPPAMLQALHDAGLRYGVWQVPYTARAGGADPAQPELDYATQHGFFPLKTAIRTNPWGDPIDFTNSDAYAWWQQSLRAYTAAGVEGFKLDYAEDVLVGASGGRTPWKFADGSDERTMHYEYQLLYHKLHRELLPAAGGFLLCRTGRWGDQVNGPIIWPGDLDASFAREGDPLGSTRAVGGLPAALAKGIGLSASGFPFYASDTGGYRDSPPNREVWLRWVEANAVWPAMNVGDSSSQMPWEFTPENGRDAQALADYAAYALLHLRLWPYVWTYAQQIAHGGRPIVRPLGLAYPALGAHPSDEYLLGDAIVVAPIVAAAQTSRGVLLPPGEWLDWWTGQPRTGQITAAANVDVLPLYLARGAIVPLLRKTIDTLAPATMTGVDSFANDPGVLAVRVAPGASATTVAVYDGTMLGQHPLSYAPGSVFDKGALFEQIATAMPTSVATAQGPLAHQASLAALEAAPSGWFWETATGGTLWIKVATAAVVTVQ